MKILDRNSRRFYLFLLSSFFLLVLFINFFEKSAIQPGKVSNSEIDKIRKIAVDINNECTLKNPDCYESKIRSRLLDDYSTNLVLEAIYDYDTFFSCHAFTHFLGRVLYKKTQSVADSYAQINFTCHGGTYHGVIEAFLNNQVDDLSKLSGSDIEQVCKDSRTKTNKNADAVFNECLHGFGHAFMFITNSDLPASLNLCDKLVSPLKQRCWGGAFMENSTSSTNKDHPTVWLKDNDKFYPCTILDKTYLNQCYFYQANYLLMETNHNFPLVFNDCDSLSGSHRDYCLLGIGAILASVSNERSVKYAASVCDIGFGDAKNICIEGAVSSMMQRWGGLPDKILEFCQNVELDLRSLCFMRLGSDYKIWHGERARDSFCSRLISYKKDCLGISFTRLKF